MLGSGQQLSDEHDHVSRLRLMAGTAAGTAVIIAAYRSARRATDDARRRSWCAQPGRV